MKLEINRRQLLAAVKTARKFQNHEAAKNIPILECVELCADAGDLTVMSTGLFTWYRAPLACELVEDGTVLASASRLQQLLAGIRDTTVTLTAGKSTRDDLSVHFGAGRADLTLGLETVGELPAWPVSPADDATVLLSLPLPTLRRLLSKVAHAIATTSKTLPGIARMRMEDGLLHFEATDGHRAIHTSATGLKGVEVSGIAFPLDAIGCIAQLKHDCLVTLLEFEGKVLLHLATGERVAFVSTGIDVFPDIAKFIGRRRTDEITAQVAVNREILLSAAQAASALKSVLVFESNDHENLILTCESKISGTYRHSIEAEVGGELAPTGLNPAYVIDALESIETSEVDLQFGEPDSRVDFSPTLTARSNEYQREIVMPFRIEEATASERTEAKIAAAKTAKKGRAKS